MATKREMQQFYFDKEQVRIYNNIKGAKATMDTFRETNSPGHEHNRTRKLKALQLQLGKFSPIYWIIIQSVKTISQKKIVGYFIRLPIL